jgi:hypothetical protein
MQYYEAWHMVYIRDEDLAKLKKSLGSFIERASKP